MTDFWKNKVNVHLEPFVTDSFVCWRKQGIPDFSCAIHSLGLSLWAGLGNVLGMVGVTELPALGSKIGNGITGEVLSDVIWFQKDDFQPLALLEFERYSGEVDQSKLMEKTRNLLLAFHRWEKRPEALLLIFWTKGLMNLPDLKRLESIVRNGFSIAGGEWIPGDGKVEFLCWQFILREGTKGLWQLREMLERRG
ncbi:MAG: hypothetical protein WA705_22425 [Candidatus Ozemobacteraceae bacterium]